MNTRVVIVGKEPVEKLIQSLDQLIATRERAFRAADYFVNLNYPDANPEEARELLVSKCERNRIRYCEAPANSDAIYAFNWVLQNVISAQPSDIVVYYPGLTFPEDNNWQRAISEAISEDDTGNTVWSSLLSPEAAAALSVPASRTETTLPGGLRVWNPASPQEISVSGFVYSWLKANGGLPQPTQQDSIGAQLHAKLGTKKRAFLPDFTESNILRT
jgi:hypothetical protein